VGFFSLFPHQLFTSKTLLILGAMHSSVFVNEIRTSRCSKHPILILCHSRMEYSACFQVLFRTVISRWWTS